MVDQLASAETCRACGALLNKDQFQVDGLCTGCASASTSQASWDAQSLAKGSSPLDVVSLAPEAVSPDPDRPHWGPVAGVSVWLASVAAIIVIPIIAVIVWYIVESARGAPLPNLAVRAEMIEWVKSPNLLLVQVLSTILAHAITIAICWVVVTQLGKRQFRASLGWTWGGHSVWYWAAFSVCLLVALEVMSRVLLRFLPQSEDNSFNDLVKSTQQVRIAIAILATVSAPLVEEVVYRGVLFAGLRRSFGPVAAVVFVTMLFPSVHLLQYWGSWVTMSGLVFLSLMLTLVRARTGSVLPCIAIHFVNNAVSSVVIVLSKPS